MDEEDKRERRRLSVRSQLLSFFNYYYYHLNLNTFVDFMDMWVVRSTILNV